jgi:hypothetical protein
MSMGDLSSFCSLLWSLSSLVCSSPCRGHLHPLLSLFLGIWFFFGGYYKWNCFPIFFLSLFFVGYRKATDFCLLILYPATLLKLCMVSRSFGVEFFRIFLSYKFMSSVNRDSLTISSPICILFISFSCLIAFARNSRSMLYKSGESGPPLSHSWL